MAETAAEWASPVDVGVAHPGLRPVNDVPSGPADFLAEVRSAGERWAAGHRGDVVSVLLETAGDDPELAELVRNGGSIIEEFLEGFRRNAVNPPKDLAADLVAGREVPKSVLRGLAPRYLVVLARGGVAEQFTAVPDEIAGPGVLSASHHGDLVLLVPDAGACRRGRVVEHLTGRLDGDGWIALAQRGRAELADGFREAADVLRLVAAGRRPSGVYSVPDVLVEYAVIRHQEVARNLVDVIKPLRAHTALWETLAALIAADYNRNKAANDLFIHRSTLDYRLQRIASVTGCDPTSGRGVQVLTAALIADSVR
jgi:hypothetical protein